MRGNKTRGHLCALLETKTPADLSTDGKHRGGSSHREKPLVTVCSDNVNVLYVYRTRFKYSGVLRSHRGSQYKGPKMLNEDLKRSKTLH